MMDANEILLARRDRAIPRGLATAFPVFAARAENAEMWDANGRRYIDFAGGIGVLNVGHRHPEIMRRVAAQAERYTHTCFQVLPYDVYVELAEHLNTIVPIPGQKKTVLFSTGAEVLENAVKIARCATGRSAIIAFAGAFHGRTMMTLAMTGKVTPYKVGFGPFPNEVFHVPFPSAFRGVTEDASINAIEALFAADVDPSRVAAIIIEPVQGEGGFNPAPARFLARLRQICDQRGILLIADEVQSGFARTGKMFAIEHSGIAPDMVTMAKSLGGGFPLSAVTGRAEIMDVVPPGGLGGTYAGNPLACAAALGVLTVIEKENLCARSTTLGKRLRERLEELQKRNSMSMLADIRALGGMVAVELCHNREADRPAPEFAKAVIAKARDAGLLLLACGTHGNVLRFLFPLTIEDAVFDEGLSILETVFQDAATEIVH
jgi:4-aminobutyrate aminotransferase / (S)-3-amino-2-methylpropionate transaminase / 5-aminovalerate transaminase